MKDECKEGKCEYGTYRVVAELEAANRNEFAFAGKQFERTQIVIKCVHCGKIKKQIP